MSGVGGGKGGRGRQWSSEYLTQCHLYNYCAPHLARALRWRVLQSSTVISKENNLVDKEFHATEIDEATFIFLSHEALLHSTVHVDRNLEESPCG